MTNQARHRHGGDPSSVLKKFGLSDRSLIDFSVNVNPLGMPEIIEEKWADFLDAAEIYPSVEGDGITAYYCGKFGISPENVLSGNGSTELLYLITRVLRLERVLVISPSYHDYERALSLCGTEVMRFFLLPGKALSPTLFGGLKRNLEESDGIFLGRPNNPTGYLFPKAILLPLIEKYPDKWFFIDEAFIQFVDQWKEESVLFDPPRPKVVVFHSLTKFYGLPGLRVGGMMGDSRLIEQLKSAKEPWSVNGVAEKTGPLLLHCQRYEAKTRKIVKEERSRIMRRLQALPGITPFPTSANFILCRWIGAGNLDYLLRYLLVHGIYVRDCANFPGLEDNFFRIGLRLPQDNDRLIDVLGSYAK